MARFPSNDIISLVSGETPRHDLSESYGPHARLRDIVSNFAGIAGLELLEEVGRLGTCRPEFV
jgi:hypothetical protein